MIKIKDNKMKFEINENSYLTIKDDKKETVIQTDKHELQQLMETIKKYLDDTAKKKSYAYRFNLRSRRLEKVEE